MDWFLYDRGFRHESYTGIANDNLKVSTNSAA